MQKRKGRGLIMEDKDITIQCEGFVYQKPTDLQIEIARKRCPWLFELEKVIDLRKKKDDEECKAAFQP